MKEISLLLFCLIGVSFLFTSCGKDKTVEKLIYGDTSLNMLSRDQFNSLSVSISFDNIDDFYNYIKQCAMNKTNLLGKKFRINNHHFELQDYLSYNGQNYFYKACGSYYDDDTCDIRFSVGFVNTYLYTDITSVESVTFIVQGCNYWYGSGYSSSEYEAEISGYSYL